MTAIDADVWVLTETHDTLRPGRDFQGCSTTDPDRDSEPGERWVTIWSRLPIEALPSMSDASRSVAARVVARGIGPVVVIGTVLPWLGSAWRGIGSANGEAFRAALTLQLSNWLALREAHQDAALVLAGDLNQDLSPTHYYGSRGNRAALESALAAAGIRCLTAGDSDPVRRYAAGHASIDHICVGAGLEPLSPPTSWPRAPRPQASLSDHFGVMVELEASP